ncbi:DUF502 domain-containing protein [Parvibium lacunae]|uniref:DUF502 domain-containing protein n=2 Tax=Parvibium lacunae TaxID=1888893 RepID=A0A368KZY6_9BURK|nr:DUF502 domain-containing protein [Parvibium lacunae]
MLKRYFITGLLIWVPLAITLWVLNLVVGTMDQTLTLLPLEWHPRTFFGRDIPGMGVILTLLVLLLTGILATNFIGQRLVRWWDGLLKRIPVVNSIYSSVKQVSDTLFSSGGQAFRKAVLIRYPHDQVWTIAFVTGNPAQDCAQHFSEEHISVYVPTTPNPTSGFFLMVPKSQIVELSMSVDEALKYIVSMGVVVPQVRQ